MSTTMTRDEAEALKPLVETRAKLREMFPQTRGAFSATVSNADAVAILCGDLNVDVAIKAWADAQAQVASKLNL